MSFETATRGLDHQEIRVGDKVWIRAGATILPGVTKDVPAYTLVGGVPARKIRDIEPAAQRQGAIA